MNKAITAAPAAIVVFFPPLPYSLVFCSFPVSDEACEAAYFKMNNAIIDDRRVRVDFSQSVHHLWRQFRK